MKEKYKILYKNKMLKVIFFDFGLSFGKLYGVFDLRTTNLSLSTVVTARKSLKEAIKVADYLLALNEWGKAHERIH